MDFVDYRKRLGIGFNDKRLEDLFFSRIFNLLNGMKYMRNQLTREEYGSFCMKTGVAIKYHLQPGEYWYQILNILSSCNQSIQEFLSYYIFFVICLNDQNNKTTFINYLRNCLNESHIPYEPFEDNDGYFVFTKGAKELDDALVSEPLEWLSGYPIARKTFINALRQYSEGKYTRDVADNLRKSLEAFLQEFLDNGKNLENNKTEICKYLGEQGVDAGISGLFQPLINSYKNINDRMAKHNDAVDEKLLEFLLYQTGLLIRMVITIKNSEEDKNET